MSNINDELSKYIKNGSIANVAWCLSRDNYIKHNCEYCNFSSCIIHQNKCTCSFYGQSDECSCDNSSVNSCVNSCDSDNYCDRYYSDNGCDCGSKSYYQYLDITRLLILAVKYNHLRIVKFFVDLGVAIPYEALLTACEEGHLNIVKYLIEEGADAVILSKEITKKLVSLGIQLKN